ncbi:MAG: D-amino acid dehydrogenase [Rhodospirillaceae bacterium]|nr:D-amino acid dehydrogenase [Rhodospirillaceae bacterium]
MKILILGAGVIGVTSAWYLAKAGHDVVVIDRQPSAGLETSFANGGQISPCHAEPWANSSTLKTALKWIGRKDAPLFFHFDHLDPSILIWSIRFLLNCTSFRSRINTERILRIALYSLSSLQSLRTETGINYDQKTTGILHIYRNKKSFNHAITVAEMMNKIGLLREIKNADEVLSIEPALVSIHKELAGGIFTASDESGDAYKFTKNLANLCVKRGVIFHYNTTIIGLEMTAGQLVSVATNNGRMKSDAFVIALGSCSPSIARQIGINLPICPAKGYSTTIVITDPNKAPSVAITDDENKLVYSRLGNRLRCAGTAELATWNLEINPTRVNIVTAKSRTLFPDIGDFDNPQIWCGLRPVTPDSIPIIGRTQISNLFLNTGHGTLGWTMSCGSGRLLTDLISNRLPDIDMSGLSLNRFRII